MLDHCTPAPLAPLRLPTASERARLAQVANKCEDSDLDFFIREAGDIAGIVDKMPADKRDSRHVLEFLVRAIANWKKLSPAPLAVALEGLMEAKKDEAGKPTGSPDRPAGIATIFANDLSTPQGAAGMRPGVAARFDPSSAPTRDLSFA